jgi:hypothetical protein
MSTLPFKVGASRKKITPTPEMGPVYRAGYKMGEAEQLTGVVDDIFLRCLTIETETDRVAFLSLDLIGLFRDFTEELEGRFARQGIDSRNLIVATTHIHSGPDTMGLWGPSIEESGYNEQYGEFLLETCAKAVAEAAESARSTQAYLAYKEKNLGVSNYRQPEELSLALWTISFRTEDDETIGTLISYTAQPELAPRDDDRISAGYPGEACRLLDKALGGTTLFLLGTCGAMEPEGCEEGYDAAHAYGAKLADELLRMNADACPLAENRLAVTTAEVKLPVENPGFQLMMQAGIIRTSQRPPDAVTTISKVNIGEIVLFTLPGEAFPGTVADIAKDSQQPILFINQVNDSLGYFIPPDQFRSEPTEWAEGHHFTGHELESLGPQAGEALRQKLLSLAAK